MGTKLSKAPVYYTVAQVQFNHVLNLDSYLPTIQSKMREAHYPDFKHDVIQQVVIPFGGAEGGQAAPTISPQARYIFGDIKGRASFILTTNTLSYQTTAYDTYEIFSSTLLRGLGFLHEVLSLDFIERIGIRYLDAVQPLNDGDNLKNFLVPEVLGLSHRCEGQLLHSISESFFMTPAGQLMSRVLIRDGQIGLPADLASLAPAIDERISQKVGLHAILDNDAFYTNREAFDLGAVEKRISALHDEISKSFKATVTPHAEAAWA